MYRPVLIELALFLAPFAVYAIFLWATRAHVFEPESWPISRIVTIAIVGFALMIGSFIVLAQFGGVPKRSTYVPAHVEDGKFVPGQYR